MYDSNQGWYSLLEQMIMQLRQQNTLLGKLEQTMGEVRDKLSKQEQNDRMHIDKVEYRFDQLKVETLEGTLHIGVVPGQDHSAAVFSPAPLAAMHHAVRTRIHRYLNDQLPARIRTLQDEHQCVIGTDYEQEMIHDLKKQGDERIAYYLHHPQLTGDDKDKETFVYEQTMVDIEKALEQHFLNLKQEREDHEHKRSE